MLLQWLLLLIVICSIHVVVSKELHITNVTCIRDEEFLSLVHSAPTRSLMYVFCHNDHTAEIARNVTSCWGDWVQILLLSESKFFESSAYRYILPHLQPNWERYDYVITATYKTLAVKIGGKFLQSTEIMKHGFDILTKGPYQVPHHPTASLFFALRHALTLWAPQVYPFLRADDDSRYWGEKYHGRRYSEAWDSVLTQQGFTKETIHAFDHRGVFYRNIYICQAAAFKGLVDAMATGVALAEGHTQVKTKMEVDSGYSFPDPQLAQKIYNHSNYHMHPFVFERMPAFYLFTAGVSVCIGVRECPQNF